MMKKFIKNEYFSGELGFKLTISNVGDYDF